MQTALDFSDLNSPEMRQVADNLELLRRKLDSAKILLDTKLGPVGTDANTDEKTLLSYILSKEEFIIPGSVLTIKAVCKTAANANSKTFKLKFGGFVVSFVTSVNNEKIEIEFHVVCITSSSQYITWKKEDQTTITTGASFAEAENALNAINILVTGQNAVAQANELIAYVLAVSLQQPLGV